jgi:hypothetical protein
MAFNIATVTLHEAASIAERLIGVTNKPIFLWGAPGVGKSAIVRQIVARLTETTGRKRGLVDVRASQLAAVDTRGVPTVNKRGETSFAIPSWLPRVERDGEFGILLLDEFMLATPSVQAAFYQLLHERQLGDYKLPDGWVVIAASNRPEDGAGVHGRIDTAVTGRFATHLNIVPCVYEVLEYANANDWDERLYAFLDYRGRPTLRGDGTTETAGLIHEYPDGGAPKGHIAIATPRTWEAANDILRAELPDDLQHAALQGVVGIGAAAEFTGFLAVFDGISDVSVILHHPDQATVPVELSTQYATTVILAKRCNEENIGNAVAFIKKMDDELVSIFFKIATMRDEAFFNTAEYVQFKVDNNI